MSTQRGVLSQRNVLGLIGVCLVVILLSVAGLASDFVTHLLRTVDGLLLLMISLMMAGIFALMLFMIAGEAGWIPARHHEEQPTAAAVPPKPAPAVAAKTTPGVPVGSASREGK